jgi:Flp pilus assembly protein TadG
MRVHGFRLQGRAVGRRRRGAELIEFALVFPVFLFLFFGIMEYSWYFFQRGAVTEATRLGCQAGSHQDPQADDDGDGTPDFIAVASSVINAELGRQAGIRCGEGGYNCAIQVNDLSDPTNDPPRVTCTTSVNFQSLTGFLGSDADPGGGGSQLAHDRWGTEAGGRMLPQFIVGRSTAIFEGSE